MTFFDIILMRVSVFAIMLYFWLLIFFPSTTALKALMITIGEAGHFIPMFEIAKAMKHHDVTFITESLTQNFVNFKIYNSSSFRILFTNDSMDARIDEAKRENDLMEYIADRSLLEGMPRIMPHLARSVDAILNKTIHLIMGERFDVIIADSFIRGLRALSNDTNVPCVVQSAAAKLDLLAINLPNRNSFLSSTQISEFKYRIYNVAFHARLIITSFVALLPLRHTIFRSLPQIPGPFYQTLSYKNQFFIKTKCLQLSSVPWSLFPLSESDPYSKYLGAFIDESSTYHVKYDLAEWIQSKPDRSIIYVAFGSVVRISIHRMKSLVDGLMEFLLRNPTASVLFAFRHTNYKRYEQVKNGMEIEEYRRILSDEQRCRLENHFVPQKWILQQHSVSLFLSHCGMGSIGEGLYFEKPILCLPLGLDQFVNAMAIENSGLGQSLFVPPSLWESLIRINSYHYYTFSADDVAKKLFTIWANVTYERTVKMMSLEMKHAGGVKRAVEEIEFFVNFHGNLDNYMPFQSTLAFYQMFMLDIIFVFLLLPIVIIIYAITKCRRRNKKIKLD